jgi:ATP-dependent protease ClpP protease subunit
VITPNDYNLHRKPLIKKIQKQLKAKLIVYTASPYHPFPQIMIQDVPLFEDLLRSVSGAEEGYLMINSPGGDANAAEKLLMMCREIQKSVQCNCTRLCKKCSNYGSSRE